EGGECLARPTKRLHGAAKDQLVARESRFRSNKTLVGEKESLSNKTKTLVGSVGRHFSAYSAPLGHPFRQHLATRSGAPGRDRSEATRSLSPVRPTATRSGAPGRDRSEATRPLSPVRPTLPERGDARRINPSLP